MELAIVEVERAVDAEHRIEVKVRADAVVHVEVNFAVAVDVRVLAGVHVKVHRIVEEDDDRRGARPVRGRGSPTKGRGMGNGQQELHAGTKTA